MNFVLSAFMKRPFIPFFKLRNSFFWINYYWLLKLSPKEKNHLLSFTLPSQSYTIKHIFSYSQSITEKDWFFDERTYLVIKIVLLLGLFHDYEIHPFSFLKWNPRPLISQTYPLSFEPIPLYPYLWIGMHEIYKRFIHASYCLHFEIFRCRENTCIHTFITCMC